MPATRTRVTRGRRPIGDSFPRGDVTVTTSPTPTFSESASAAPRSTGAGPSADTSNDARGASRTFATTSVTVRSSAGTIPLRVATAADVVLVRSTLPYIAGAAPATPGTARTLFTTAA